MIIKQSRLSDQEYRAMSPKEAKEYFQWFMTNIPNEIEILKRTVGNKITLDFSPESLIQLEGWFLPLRAYNLNP
jgi:hypothetical protein